MFRILLYNIKETYYRKRLWYRVKCHVLSLAICKLILNFSGKFSLINCQQCFTLPSVIRNPVTSHNSAFNNSPWFSWMKYACLFKIRCRFKIRHCSCTVYSPWQQLHYRSHCLIYQIILSNVIKYLTSLWEVCKCCLTMEEQIISVLWYDYMLS